MSRMVREIDITAEGGVVGVPRVLIVDDHVLLAEGVARALDREGIDVEIAASTTEDVVVEAARRFGPDVVLLDLMLGHDSKGSDLIEPLRSVSSASIVMLTGVTDTVDLATCLEAGATGVVAKTRTLPEIVDVVRAAAEGQQPTRAHERAEMMADLFRHRAEEDERLEPFRDLTRREEEILAALMAGKNPQMIADDDFVSVGTVRSQLKALFRKLRVNSQLAAVAAAREAGWSLDRAGSAP